MAYNPNAPSNTQFLADFPPEMREQLRAIIEDEIVNALKLCGLSPTNSSGGIPVSNGTLCVNLNADLLDGKEDTDFALAGHTHAAATVDDNGFMSNTDKVKLNGIASGAEVNQNAFANVLVGSTTVQADAKQDTLELEAGQNIALTPDGTNDKVTIAFSGVLPVANGGTGVDADTKYLKLTGGTVTGNIVLDKSATTPVLGTPIQLPFQYKNKSTGTGDTGRTITPFFIFPSNDASGTVNGEGFGIQTGGAVVIGAGESPRALVSALTLNGSTESAYFTADSSVNIVTNGNTIANRKTFTFTTDGKLQFPDGSKIWIS